MFDIAFKKPRSQIYSQLPELATSARQQRDLVRKKIKELDQLSVSSSENSVPLSNSEELDQSPVSSSKKSVPRPNSVLKLSDPDFETDLPFPFVGVETPERFNEHDENTWFYMGREKFTELLDEFEKICKSTAHRDLMVYGTKGYGKSHLLAALVCYLTAREQRVVYIPDCRLFFEHPVTHMISAMLFAWADDESEQQNIMALNTPEEIYEFFRFKKDVIFVIDQLNALEREREDEEAVVTDKVQMRKWLKGLRAPGRHKAILSSSANNNSIHQGASRQSINQIMYLYGGFTRVSIGSKYSFVKKRRF